MNASTPSRNPLYLIERDCRPIHFTQEEKRYFSKTAISQPTCCLDRGRHPCAQRVVDCVGRNTQTKAPQTPFRVMGRSRNSPPPKTAQFQLRLNEKLREWLRRAMRQVRKYLRFVTLRNEGGIGRSSAVSSSPPCRRRIVLRKLDSGSTGGASPAKHIYRKYSARYQ